MILLYVFLQIFLTNIPYHINIHYTAHILFYILFQKILFSLNYCKNTYICWIDKRRTIIPERIFISLKTEGKYFFIARLYR